MIEIRPTAATKRELRNARRADRRLIYQLTFNLNGAVFQGRRGMPPSMEEGVEFGGSAYSQRAAL